MSEQPALNGPREPGRRWAARLIVVPITVASMTSVLGFSWDKTLRESTGGSLVNSLPPTRADATGDSPPAPPPREPEDAASSISRGDLRRSLGDYAEAKADYERALRFDPDSVEAHCALSWLLSTCPDPSFRDGKRARILADRAWDIPLRSTEMNLIPIVDNARAASRAELGDFKLASAYQMEAIAGRETRDLTEDWWERLGLYQNGAPFRELPRGDEGPSRLPRRGGVRHMPKFPPERLNGLHYCTLRRMFLGPEGKEIADGRHVDGRQFDERYVSEDGLREVRVSLRPASDESHMPLTAEFLTFDSVAAQTRKVVEFAEVDVLVDILRPRPAQPPTRSNSQ